MRCSRRAVAPAIAVLLALGALTACGEGPAPEPSAPAQATATEQGAKNRDGDMRGATSRTGEQAGTPAAP